MKDNQTANCLPAFDLPKLIALSVLTFCFMLGASCTRSSLPPNAERLALGKPFTKPLKNDEIHSYMVNLEEGQFLALSVEQHDVDVITKAFAPGGELLGEFDTPTSGRGTELIRIGAEQSGEYRFDIYTLSAGAEPGRYTLQQTALRPLTEHDRKILNAVKLHQQADALRAKPETRRDSLPLYEKALHIWRETGERKEEANTLRAMGFAYQRLEELDQAKSHFRQALDIWESVGDLRSAAFTHVIFGVMSKKRNDYETGLQEDLKALSLWEKAGDMPEFTQQLVRIGNDYIKLNKREEALSYFKRALEASRQVESRALKAYVLSQYGDAQATFGNKAEARDSYQESLALWESLKQEKNVVQVKEKIAQLP